MDNADFCSLCGEDIEKELLLLCDGCPNSFHPSCIRPQHKCTPQWFGYPNSKWYSEACRKRGKCTCVLKIKEREQHISEYASKSRETIATVLLTEESQEIVSYENSYDESVVLDNLAKTFGLYYSDPSPENELVLVARMSLPTTSSDARATAWGANSLICDVHGLTASILPIDPDIMGYIKHNAVQANVSLFSAWRRMLQKAQQDKDHRIIERIDDKERVISKDELRLVPQFDHTELSCISLEDGRSIQCICGQKLTGNVYFRKIGRFCWVTGQSCNAYTKKSALAPEHKNGRKWVEEIRILLQAAMDKGFLDVCSRTEFDNTKKDEDDLLSSDDFESDSGTDSDSGADSESGTDSDSGTDTLPNLRKKLKMISTKCIASTIEKLGASYGGYAKYVTENGIDARAILDQFVVDGQVDLQQLFSDEVTIRKVHLSQMRRSLQELIEAQLAFEQYKNRQFASKKQKKL